MVAEPGLGIACPAMRPLVALDLDGTLLTEESVLTAGHERTVRELQRAGCHIAIVTGRPVLITQAIWKRLGLTTPLVCFNGGWVGFPGQPALACLRLDEDDTRDILAALRGRGGVACGYPDEKSWWMDRLAMETAGWPAKYGTSIEIRPEDFTPWKGPSFKVMYVADPLVTPGIVADLRERFRHRFHVVLSQPDRLEILPKGISKVWGDADNDLEMVAWAGHGCAMGHAPEKLLRVARHVLPGIHARGLCALPLLMQRTIAGRA
jgi:hydroxymethylpyrimidine pyrophosphatase-like HAD family hydrolase